MPGRLQTVAEHVQLALVFGSRLVEPALPSAEGRDRVMPAVADVDTDGQVHVVAPDVAAFPQPLHSELCCSVRSNQAASLDIHVTRDTCHPVGRAPYQRTQADK